MKKLLSRTLKTVSRANKGVVVALSVALAFATPATCLGCPTQEDATPMYNSDDLEVIAHVICGEAQSYSDEEQLYVGSVVLNRVASKHYPNTIRGVVFQKGQYACTWDGNYNRTPTERNWKNAQYLLEHGSVLPENVVYQAGFKQGKGVYVHTKYHYYCYE